jgi:predicted phage tail protein
MEFNKDNLKKFAPWIAAGAIAGAVSLFMKKGSSQSQDTTAAVATVSNDAVQQTLSEYTTQTNNTMREFASETNASLKEMADSYNSQLQTISGNLTTLQGAMQDEENQYNAKITELTNNLNTVNSQNQQLQSQLSNAVDKANGAYSAIHELQTSTARQQTAVNQDAKTSSGGTSLSGQVITAAKWYSTSTNHDDPNATWTAYDSSGNKVMNGYVADSHGVAEVKNGAFTGKYVEKF